MQTKELVEALTADDHEALDALPKLRPVEHTGHITWRFSPAVRDLIVHLTRLPTSSGGRGEAWRPIESAPKDGTTIDVWRPEHGRDTVFWGHPHHDCGEMGGLCDSDWHSIRAPGWVCATFGEFLGRKYAPFTHWMPLPSSPSQGGCEGLGSLPPFALPEAVQMSLSESERHELECLRKRVQQIDYPCSPHCDGYLRELALRNQTLEGA